MNRVYQAKQKHDSNKDVFIYSNFYSHKTRASGHLDNLNIMSPLMMITNLEYKPLPSLIITRYIAKEAAF